MTAADSPITISRDDFGTTYADSEYEITLATVKYSDRDRRWHTRCYISDEEYRETARAIRVNAERIAITHAFAMHKAIDAPGNLERLITQMPACGPWPAQRGRRGHMPAVGSVPFDLVF